MKSAIYSLFLILVLSTLNPVSASDIETWIKQFGPEPSASQSKRDVEPAQEVEVDSSPMAVYEKHGLRFIAPLGVEFKIHGQRRYGSADDQTMFPKFFMSAEDGLLMNLIETRGTIPPKSPVGRAGIQHGDLIYAINGQFLLDGVERNVAIRNRFASLHAHGLRSHLADLCNEGFTDGKITFSYLRFPKKVARKELNSWKSKEYCPQSLPENFTVPLNIDMKKGNTLRIKLPQLRKEGPRGDTTQGCFHFINPRFILKDGSEVSLSRATPKNLYRRIGLGKISNRRAATKFISNRPLRKGAVTFKGRRLSNYFTVIDGGDLEFTAPEDVASFQADLHIVADPRGKSRNTPEALAKIKYYYQVELSAHQVDDSPVARYDWTDIQTIAKTTAIDLPLKNSRVIALEVFSKDQTPDETELSNPIDLSNLRLVNDDGKIKLAPQELSVAWAAVNGIGALGRSRSENYGVTGSRDGESGFTWTLAHAPLRVVINIPPDQGEWRLKGEVKWSETARQRKPKNAATKLVISTAPQAKFPGSWKAYTKTATVSMPPFGSLLTEDGKFDPSNPAIKNVNDLIGHSLMVKQTPEGFWPVKQGSYAPPSFTTSISALGLMATGDEKYNDTIKKAAYHVASSGGSGSTWTYTNSLEVVFLSEYYLRTKDKAILSALKHRVFQLEKFMTPDFYAGHKLYPGYSGYGWIGPGGMLSLAWAAASHTPAGQDDRIQYKLDKMLEAISRLAPNGTMPYGRGKAGRPYGAYQGQAGSVGNGPYFIASSIRGGGEPFRSAAAKRYGNPPYGNANQSHAAPDLSVLWAVLASANVSQDAYCEMMTHSFWMICQHIHYSCYLGEDAMQAETGGSTMHSCGKPGIHIGIALLALNAGNQNLAITGKKEFVAAKTSPSEFIYNMDYRLHRTYQRNWQIIDAYLGKKSPRVIRTALTELQKVRLDKNYGLECSKVYKKYATQIAAALPKGMSANDHAFCIKLAYGQTTRLKVDIKKTTKGWEAPLEFKVNERFDQLNPAFQGKEDTYLPVWKATATLQPPTGKDSSFPVENGKKELPTLKISKSQDLATFLSKVNLQVQGTIDGHAFAYDLPFKRPTDLRKIGTYKFANQHTMRLPNLVLNDPYGQWSAIATLSNGAAIDLAHTIGMDRRMHIDLDGERMDQAKTGLLPAGLVLKAVHLGTPSNWEQRVRLAEVTKADLNATLLRPSNMLFDGKKDPKLGAAMHDFDLATQSPAAKKGAAAKDQTVIYEFNSPIVPEHLFVALAGRSSPAKLAIEYWKGNRWEYLCTTTVYANEFGRYFSTGETEKTNRLRFTFRSNDGSTNPRFSEIRVHKPYQHRLISREETKR